MSLAQGVHQYLTFVLGAEEFGIDILRVQEIKGHSTVTLIPNAPNYVRGVVNLRGSVVPIIDLRTMFSMETRAWSQKTVFIVVTLENKAIGLVVDAVSDVLDVSPTNIAPPPELAGQSTTFLTGLAKSGERLVLLLDIQALLHDATSASPELPS